jgi:hypothetical protein
MPQCWGMSPDVLSAFPGLLGQLLFHRGQGVGANRVEHLHPDGFG